MAEIGHSVHILHGISSRKSLRETFQNVLKSRPNFSNIYHMLSSREDEKSSPQDEKHIQRKLIHVGVIIVREGSGWSFARHFHSCFGDLGKGLSAENSPYPREGMAN